MNDRYMQKARTCHACGMVLVTDAKGIHDHWVECFTKLKHDRQEESNANNN